MKLSTFIIIAVAVSFTASISVYLMMHDTYIYELREIPMDIRLGDNVGFILDWDMLHFGTIRMPGIAHRNVTIENSYPHDVRVIIKFSGDMAGWTHAKPSNFVMGTDEIRSIEFSANPSSGMAFGNYTGTAYLYFTKP